MDTNSKYVNISKLDAAKRQLEFSIKLFFRNSDVVVIHTLAAAAHEIFRGLGKKQGVRSLIKDQALDVIKKDKQKVFLATVNKAENFFKHANWDSDEQLKFHFESTAFLIFDACEMYQVLTKETVPLFGIFKVWFLSKYPELVIDEHLKQQTEKYKSCLNPDNRSGYLEMLPILEDRLLS